uniref:Origin recognition complex subunit 1 n=1 Tax=Esox lucius TaxID=8010 RepID=A0A3P8Z012_ESOLU
MQHSVQSRCKIMVRYFTRLRVRRVYKWDGTPSSFDRKLKTYFFDSLNISVEGQPGMTTVTPGQYVLIEGDNEDNPFVAKLLKFFGDESNQQKKALVQWFVRVCEVPHNKKKLLGRSPHPQEVFYYLGHTCDNEIDAESILNTVQVQYVPVDAPFPEPGIKDTLYVKLSWDTKTFKDLDPALMQDTPVPASTPPRLKPASPRAGSVSRTRGPVSASKAGNNEAESVHSAAKLSASKTLSTKRRGSSGVTPGVRKKLQLSPEKIMSRKDGLCELLDEEVDSEKALVTKLNSSPRSLHHGYSLSPSPCELQTSLLIPFCVYSLPQRATTPSRRKDSAMTAREPSLGVLAEEDSESSPMQLVVTSSRSKRKSAQLVASRIRKQLNLMGDAQELHSDDGDDDCFTPSKKDLHHSSEEDLEDEEVSKSEETAGKTTRGRLRRASTTPARTPRKPPSKKVGSLGTSWRRPVLHVSSVPESLPCREQEFQDIYNFVESKVMDGTGGCMYISGVPGTGKTATVHEVIRCLQHASDMDEIPTFRFVEINGMKMTDPHQAYVQILQKLTDQKATADHAAALLEKMFSNPAPKKETTVLLVDELDLLWTRKQNVMYNLFDWPTRRHARLVVLTIANTMDLPERIMINRVASRLGLTRMSFQPYSFKQLQQIITSRLNKVKAFEEDALQLVSRKVAALSGDARRCLDICRRATEICEHSAPQPSSTGLVGMSHVMEALDEMFSSSYITAIRCASVQEQLFLRAVLAEFRRLGLEEATFQQVFVQHRALCRVEGLQPLSVSEGLAVCQRLGACRLLLLEASRLDVLQRVRLNVSQDDVLYALKADRA